MKRAGSYQRLAGRTGGEATGSALGEANVLPIVIAGLDADISTQAEFREDRGIKSLPKELLKTADLESCR